MAKALRLPNPKNAAPDVPAIGICATCDPRIDAPSRERAQNIVAMVAEAVAREVRLPDGSPARVVFSDILVDGEPQADIVAKQFKAAGVGAIVCAPDTWAFPQPSLLSLLAHFPKDIPIN